MSGAGDDAFELVGDLVVEQRPVGLVRIVETHGLQHEQLLAERAEPLARDEEVVAALPESGAEHEQRTEQHRPR